MQEKTILAVEKILNYKFSNKELLVTALQHSSFDKNDNYEKLEFLGDTVLQIAVSTFLFEKYHFLQEGEMTVTRAYVVCEDTLALICKKIGLNKYIKIGNSGVSSKVNKNKSVMADVFESVVGAMYMDSGLQEASTFIISHINDYIVEYIKSGDNNDSKTKLQHIVQSYYQKEPQYSLKGEKGPPHDKTFIAQVHINGVAYGQGKGKTKKEAQQAAAKSALKRIDSKGLE